MSASILRKLGEKKFDIFPTNFIMTNFYSTIAQRLRVIFIKLTVSFCMTKKVFFIIDVATSYNALLRQDWIHASRYIFSSLDQYLIMWHNNGLTEVVKANVKPFIGISNVVDALIYTKDIAL